MKYKISKSIPIPKQKEHKSKFDEIPIEDLPVGGNYLLDKIVHAKGHSKNYMAKLSSWRNGMIISAAQKRLAGKFDGDIQVNLRKNPKNPDEKEIRVFRPK